MPAGMPEHKRESSGWYSILDATWHHRLNSVRIAEYRLSPPNQTLFWTTNRDSLPLHDPASQSQTPLCQVKR